MATIIFYVSILISSTYFVYISDKGKGLLEKRIFLTIAFLLVFLPSALRYDIGTDFLNYINIYENLDLYTYLEPGFYYLNWFLNILNSDSQWLFVICSFIFTWFFFASYPKKGAWVIHFSMMTLLWFISFNTIRQAVAVAICSYGLTYFFKKKYYLFFLFCLLGLSFHSTALLILLAGIVALIPVRNTTKSIILPNIFIIIIIFGYTSISIATYYIEQILGLIGLNQYLSYFGSEQFINNDIGSGLGGLIRILFSTYILFNSKQILSINKNYWLLILLTFLYALGTALAVNIILFSRMQQTFIMAPIIGSYIIYHLPINNNLHKKVVLLFFAFLFLTFVKESIGAKSTYSDPKINPYQTIFSQTY